MNFLSVADFFCPIRTLRKKSITKPWFDTDVLNSIWNGDKYYKKIKRSDREIDKGNFKRVKILPKKVNNKENFTWKRIAGNKNNSIELWRNLKSLSMLSKWREAIKNIIKRKWFPLIQRIKQILFGGFSQTQKIRYFKIFTSKK